MNTYKVLTSNRKLSEIKAYSAADAIQIALEKNVGHTVSYCYQGTVGSAITVYDIPPHCALSESPVKKKKKPIQAFGGDPLNKPARWIQEWMDKRAKAT